MIDRRTVKRTHTRATKVNCRGCFVPKKPTFLGLKTLGGVKFFHVWCLSFFKLMRRFDRNSYATVLSLNYCLWCQGPSHPWLFSFLFHAGRSVSDCVPRFLCNYKKRVFTLKNDLHAFIFHCILYIRCLYETFSYYNQSVAITPRRCVDSHRVTFLTDGRTFKKNKNLQRMDS